jgi:hypothetical protein
MPVASLGNTKSNSTANISVASLRQNGTIIIINTRHDSACELAFPVFAQRVGGQTKYHNRWPISRLQTSTSRTKRRPTRAP